MLSERGQTKGRLLYDVINMKCWKRQNCRDRKHRCGRELGGILSSDRNVLNLDGGGGHTTVYVHVSKPAELYTKTQNKAPNLPELSFHWGRPSKQNEQ